jgi:pimeloyl-ACP methyl ester carboxylesterase
LILASGYYYPTVRADVLVLSPPALPLIGAILSHTISPILGRLLWPLFLRKIFAPNAVPKKFADFPEEMAMRPSQIRAAAAETALMIPAAFGFRKIYGQLKMPVAIVAGRQDRVSEAQQSEKLHRDIAQSTFRCISNKGHMVHQTATAEVMSAIDLASQKKEAVGAIGTASRQRRTLGASVT